MSNILASKITISSTDQSPANSNYYTINPPITIQKHGGYRVNLVILPSYYNVNSNSNILQIKNSAGTTFNVALTNGYYTANDLLTALASALGAAGTGQTWTIVSNPTSLNSGASGTYKVTISSSANFQILTTDYPQLANILGFVSDKSGTNSYVSDNVVNVSGYNNVYLCSSVLSGFNNADNVFSSSSGDKILLVPVQAQFGSQTYYEVLHKEFHPCHNDQSILLNRIDLYFRDDRGNLIDFDSSSNFVVELSFF